MSLRFLSVSLVIFIVVTNSYSQSRIYDFDSLVLHSQEFATISKIIGDTTDLFNDNKILEVTLESDFKNLVKRKYKDEYQVAILRIMFNDTVQVTRKIKIKARGVMRKSTCMIPPLKLNFPKKDAYIKQLEDFDKIKMVLDCRQNSMHEQYIFLEYYAYKIQNIITDYSLRVRMMNVKYTDTGGKFKETTRYAFLIENIDQLAGRMNAVRIESKSVRDIQTDIKVLVDAYLFQYLIGNTDWSIPNLHNIYLVKSLDFDIPKPYVIPYDFDYAGLVNASYAVPDERLGIATVRERVYRGICLPDAKLFTSAEHILEKKIEINNLIEKDTLLTKVKRQSTLNYLEEFFEILESQKSFERNLIRSCR